MDSVKVLKFPGHKKAAVTVSPVTAPVSVVPLSNERATAAPRAPSSKLLMSILRAFLMVVVILNRPLGWAFGAVFGWYFLRWVFLSGASGTFAGFVALASFVAIVALKYLVISWKGSPVASSSKRQTIN